MTRDRGRSMVGAWALHLHVVVERNVVRPIVFVDLEN
jgi:hypothetical protein